MSITYAQVRNLLRTVSTAAPDSLDCDGCFALMAEYADAERMQSDLSEVLQSVRNHLRQCPCCAYEYETLLEALQAADTE